MSYKFEVKEQEPQPTLSMRKTAPVEELPQVLGSVLGAIAAHRGEIGEQPSGAPYVAYRATSGLDNLEVDLKPFLDDSTNREGGPSGGEYVINIQAGFEIWSGGAGLSCDCFWANVN